VLTASADRNVRIAAWVLQLVLAAAFVAVGALPKLTGDPAAVALFEKLGFPAGRYIVGGAEALAVVLLLAPRAHAIGGVLVMLLMLGAIGSHLGPLGISTELTVEGETSANPALFFMAIIFLVLGAAVAVLRRDELPIVGDRFRAGPLSSPASAG